MGTRQAIEAQRTATAGLHNYRKVPGFVWTATITPTLTASELRNKVLPQTFHLTARRQVDADHIRRVFDTPGYEFSMSKSPSEVWEAVE